MISGRDLGTEAPQKKEENRGAGEDGRCCPPRPSQSMASVYCLLCPPPAPPITEMLLPISAFTYHFPGDIELPMPRPPRHIFELTQLLFIPTNNLVMKY